MDTEAKKELKWLLAREKLEVAVAEFDNACIDTGKYSVDEIAEIVCKVAGKDLLCWITRNAQPDALG